MKAWLLVISIFLSQQISAKDATFTKSELCTISGINDGKGSRFISYVAMHAVNEPYDSVQCGNNYEYRGDRLNISSKF